MFRKLLLSTIVLLTLLDGIHAQDFEVPKKYKFKIEEDYRQEEPNIYKAVDWMVNTPIGTDLDKREKANRYILKWLEGTPTFTLTVTQEALPYMKDCAPCLIIYMGGWAQNAIKNPTTSDNVSGSTNGTLQVIKFYELNQEILGKVKSIDKLVKMREKGKLEGHIKSLWN